MDILDKDLGPEDKLSVSLVGGKLIIKNEYMGSQVGGEVSIIIDGKAFLDKLKVAIPGNWDDLVINALEGVLP